MFLSALLLLFGVGLLATAWKAFVIVPQGKKFVIERLGKYQRVLGPGLNYITPWLETVRREVVILERPLSDLRQSAITKDNVVIDCVMALFYRVVKPEDMIYRIADVDTALTTTISGIVRAEIGKIELDQVQSRRSELNEKIKEELAGATSDWGIVITRAELLGIDLDESTRKAMMQQIAAERERRAAVTRAEGNRRSLELQADAQLYAARRTAEAREVTAKADASATRLVAEAISAHGTEALEFEIRKRQIEAMGVIGAGEGARTVLIPADLAEAFGNAAKMFSRK